MPRDQARPIAPLVLALLGSAALVGCGFGGGGTEDKSAGGASSRSEGRQAAGRGDNSGRPVAVRVVYPQSGGLPRYSTQPATVYSFQTVDLYASVSGYLKSQAVDIGDVVQKGDVLAVIDAPQLERELEHDEALVRQAKTDVDLYKAKLTTAQANVKQARSRVAEAESALTSKQAMVKLRQEQHDRFERLVRSNAIEPELLDEKTEALLAAQAERESSSQAVRVAQSEVVAAQAAVEQAQAQIEDAQAAVAVAEAARNKTQVFVNFLTISAPFDGVITQRNFDPGDFIGAAGQIKGEPILSVARTDLMRIVTYIPDRDVPLVDRGDAAVLTVDALPGRQFTAQVSRMADHENYATRTMRTEVDMPNPKGLLRDGMYGLLRIELEGPGPGVTVPSQALTGKAEEHERYLFVVRDGRAQKLRVRTGLDNGTEAEVLKGLTPQDEVIAEHGPDLAGGEPVRVLGTFQPPTQTASRSDTAQDGTADSTAKARR